MALPQSISGDLEPCAPPMKAPNGAIYQIVADSTSVEVWKLADPDSGSWSEQDAGNKPTAGATGTIDWMLGCQYEHLFFMAYGVLNGSEHDIVQKQFNTATDLWVSGTQTIYSGGPGEIPGGWVPCAVVATPNYLYCAHPSDDEKVHGTPYSRSMASYRDLDGTTWTNSAELGTGAQAAVEINSLAVESSEEAVCFYWNGTTLWAILWDRSSWGDNTSLVSARTTNNMVQSVSYMDGSTNRLIVATQSSTSSNNDVARITSDGTTIVDVGDGEVASSAESGTGSRGGLARWGTTLYAWVNNSSENPAYADSTDDGATWSAPTQHSNPSNNLTEHPWANAYAREGQLRLGIVYKEGSTQLSYDERSITNPTAPGFASARTPVRQNRIFVSA